MAKKNNPAVSVIIPMFNAEKYIGETLTSLANQTFQDFEVIVADDCSTDNSRLIVNRFTKQSDSGGGGINLIKLPKNSGTPGAPRNFALTKAHGKYVYFLDSDDLLDKTALEELFNVAENFEADVVHVEKYIVFKGGNGEVHSFQTGEFVTEPTLETFDIGERVKDFTQKRYVWWACNKLFRRQFLVDNRIKFPAIKSFEDMVFAFESLIAAKNYVRVPFVSYFYRIRDDSLSHETIDGSRFMDNLCGVVKSTDDFMRGRKFFVENPQYKYLFTDFFVRERLGVFSQSFLTGKYSAGEVYDFLCKKIFSNKAQDNVALLSYLFVAANIFTLNLKQQAEEIDALKNNLEVSI